MFEIKKIRIDELEGFLKSEMFQNFSVVPVTPARAKSYLQNPRAKSGDVVLYLGFIEKQLVAFRSLFADVAFVDEKTIRFAWCSGSWVHPEFRRKGYSLQLLKEAYSDWNGKLMFTNYAPESEKLNVKTGWFQPIHKFNGVRCYLFPKTRKLVSVSNKNGFTKIIFSGLDFLINVYSSLKVSFFTPKMNSGFRFEEFLFPDKACFEWIREKSTDFLFKRGEAELKWIFENPWISSNNKQFSERYPFSSFSEKHYYQTVKVYRTDKFVGFFIFSVREGHLKTLYFHIEKGIENGVAGYLKRFCVENKIEVATIYNYGVAAQLFKRKFPFLHAKKSGQNIYSSFEITNVENYGFQDGDGDVIFT